MFLLQVDRASLMLDSYKVFWITSHLWSLGSIYNRWLDQCSEYLLHLLLPVKAERYVNNRLTIAPQVKASGCSSEQIPASVPSGWKIKPSADLFLHDLQFCRIRPVDGKTASRGRFVPSEAREEVHTSPAWSSLGDVRDGFGGICALLIQRRATVCCACSLELSGSWEWKFCVVWAEIC